MRREYQLAVRYKNGDCVLKETTLTGDREAYAGDKSPLQAGRQKGK
jgi:hypothetical protein